MRIDQETIDRIKHAAEIADVIGDYVSLKKKGANLSACCPFHGEKTPSFSVSPAKGIYKCFGCGKAGDSVRFIMDIEGIGYGEALRHLAKKYGIEIQETKLTDEQLLAQNERESLLIALNYANSFYQKQLTQSDEGRAIGYSYFKERGFSDKTIQTFELGYSLESWDAFTKDALKTGYNIEILEKAGLSLRKSDGSDKVFDRFRNRVIFPIHNVSGKTIAFGARILKPDPKNPAKYINSPETEVYHKSNVLYGIYQAKNAIRSKDVCYLVEGYTDVISLHQAGIENVVASSGTSLTLEQIRLISRFTQNVTVLYDGDAAGIKASLRGMDMILEEGLNVKLVVFPEGDDPDSYVRKIGSEAFSAHISEHATDFITFKAELFLQEAGKDPFKRAELIKDMVESISKIPDSIKRQVFFQKTAALMQMDEAILIAESNKINLERSKQRDKDQKREQNRQRLQQDLPNNVVIQNRQSPPIEDGGMMSFSEDDMNQGQEFYPSQSSQITGHQLTTNQLSTVPQQPVVKSHLTLQEQECIRLLINFGSREIEAKQVPGYRIADHVLRDIKDINFTTPIYDKILSLCRSEMNIDYDSPPNQNQLALDSDFYINYPDQEIQQEAINLILISEKHVLSDSWEKIHDIHVPKEADILAEMTFTNIVRLKMGITEKRLDDVKQQMIACQDVELQNNLVKQFMHLKDIQRLLAKELGNVVVR